MSADGQLSTTKWLDVLQCHSAVSNRAIDFGPTGL